MLSQTQRQQLLNLHQRHASELQQMMTEHHNHLAYVLCQSAGGDFHASSALLAHLPQHSLPAAAGGHSTMQYQAMPAADSPGPFGETTQEDEVYRDDDKAGPNLARKWSNSTLLLIAEMQLPREHPNNPCSPAHVCAGEGASAEYRPMPSDLSQFLLFLQPLSTSNPSFTWPSV